MERVKGIEPSSQAWEAHILPLNHTRAAKLNLFKIIAEGHGRNGGVGRPSIGASWASVRLTDDSTDAINRRVESNRCGHQRDGIRDARWHWGQPNHSAALSRSAIPTPHGREVVP